MSPRKKHGPNQLNFSTKDTQPAVPPVTTSPDVYTSPSGREYTEDELIRLGQMVLGQEPTEPTKPTDYNANWGHFREMGE